MPGIIKAVRSGILSFLPLILLITAIWNGAAWGQGSTGKAHVDKTLGFSIRVPKDWDQVLIQEKERYIVGKYISDRRLSAKKVKEWREAYSHRPEMRIIAFTPENVEMADREEKKEDVFGVTVTTIREQNPYKDFKEFTKRTQSGFYFGDEKETKVGKVPCTFIDVIMEQGRPPLRWVGCVYHLGDIDIAVYYEIMEEWYPKYKSLFNSSLRSFKTVKREAEAGVGPGAAAKPMTRKEFIASKTENLPKGWWSMTTKSHLLISHTDKGYTQKVGAFADAIRKVVDKQFKNVKLKGKKAKKDDVTLPIIRICNSPGEFNAFIETSTGYQAFNEDTKEVVVYNGTREGYPVEWVYSRVGNGIYYQYAYDLFSSFIIPDSWYITGMSYYYSSFRGKGSGIKFVRNDFERETIRKAVRNGGFSSLKSLMSPDSKGIRSYQDYLKLGTAIVFLKSKEGNRKPWKGVLDRYLKNFVDVIEMRNKKLKDDVKEIQEELEEAKDEEEGEEIVKKKSFKYDPKEIRKTVFEKTFGDWKDSNWDRLEKAWENWIL